MTRAPFENSELPARPLQRAADPTGSRTDFTGQSKIRMGLIDPRSRAPPPPPPQAADPQLRSRRRRGGRGVGGERLERASFAAGEPGLCRRRRRRPRVRVAG